ncbi:Type 1 glutamine amidotransferase-like domain-containing protein [Kocuria carniphila]|uniref:Type 1 glutamine amidotransferase-like domain-containing protein n=1 Tax=Kocuria carniphila TaxID=262208 RepID=UPI0028EE2C1E|nr:Type 1 glutamine amidotransferase-like domain-containing protein [Kocuria carniphila]
MNITLVGGGPDSTSPGCVAPFLEKCLALGSGRIGLFLTGDAVTTEHSAGPYLELLHAVRDRIDLLPLSGDVGDLQRFNAIIVGGGRTPDYHSALAASMPQLRDLVGKGAPYLGFSAGAMIAAEYAILGGYTMDGIEVCASECSEDLEALTVQAGIGIVPWTVDVHASQAGTLTRAIAAVASGGVSSAVAVDEDTALHLDDARYPRVLGSGLAWWITPAGDHVGVRLQSAEPQ